MLRLTASLIAGITLVLGQECVITVITQAGGSITAYDEVVECQYEMHANIKQQKEFYIQTANEEIIGFIHRELISKKGVQLSKDAKTLRAIKTWAETTASTAVSSMNAGRKYGASMGFTVGVFKCVEKFADNLTGSKARDALEWIKDAFGCIEIIGAMTTAGEIQGGAHGLRDGVVQGLFYSGAIRAYEVASGQEVKYHYQPNAN